MVFYLHSGLGPSRGVPVCFGVWRICAGELIFGVVFVQVAGFLRLSLFYPSFSFHFQSLPAVSEVLAPTALLDGRVHLSLLLPHAFVHGSIVARWQVESCLDGRFVVIREHTSIRCSVRGGAGMVG